MIQISKKNCIKIEIKANIPPETATKIFKAIRSSMNPEISYTNNNDEVTEISVADSCLLVNFFSQDIVSLRSVMNSNMRLIYASFHALIG